jgi:transposase
LLVSRGIAALDRLLGSCAQRSDAQPPPGAGCWLFEGQRLVKVDGVRVSTAFNRLLGLPGASVRAVRFDPDGVVVTVALRRRRRVCGRCGQVCRATHDTVLSRWRHLDLGGQRCHVTAWLRRVKCPDCGVRVEAVPWARSGSRFTRDFEDVVAWLAQQMAKQPITRLLRVAWDTVGRIVERVVADRLDETRLRGLVMIGVDEVAYRRGHRYLTCVADHDSGAIVWIRPGRNQATLQAFFEALGDRKRSIRAVSIDMTGGYENAVRAAVPDADVCFDPFHVVRLAADCVDEVRRAEWNAHGKSKTAGGKWVKHTRWALLKAPERRSARQLAILGEVQRTNRRLYRAFLLYHQLRLLYRLDDPTLAPAHLNAWLAWASRSRLKPFVRLARTIRARRDGVLAAIRLGLSNARLEGLNSKVRLISHRSFGFHSAAPLIALIYLCCGGITIDLPLR